MVTIYYNNINAFNGYSATPFVGISDEMINYGQRWGVAQRITLDGMITGSQCGTGGYLDLLNKQTHIFNNFSSDFKTLEIKDKNATVFSGKYIKVNSVDFEKSPYFLNELPRVTYHH